MVAAACTILARSFFLLVGRSLYQMLISFNPEPRKQTNVGLFLDVANTTPSPYSSTNLFCNVLIDILEVTRHIFFYLPQ